MFAPSRAELMTSWLAGCRDSFHLHLFTTAIIISQLFPYLFSRRRRLFVFVVFARHELVTFRRRRRRISTDASAVTKRASVGFETREKSPNSARSTPADLSLAPRVGTDARLVVP